MGRLLLFFVIIGALYILWDRGTFGNRTDGPGPAQILGEKIDRGVAKAGRAVGQAGDRLESAAERGAAPHYTSSPTPYPH